MNRNNYLAKPVRANTLKQLLESYLSPQDSKDLPDLQADSKKMVKAALNEVQTDKTMSNGVKENGFKENGVKSVPIQATMHNGTTAETNVEDAKTRAHPRRSSTAQLRPKGDLNGVSSHG
jgi:response regulator of citrate/malate metabolism